MAQRKKVHPEYYTIPAYMRLARKSYDDCSQKLGICTRTFKEKIVGYSDFSAVQGRILAEYLGVTQEELFFT